MLPRRSEQPGDGKPKWLYGQGTDVRFTRRLLVLATGLFALAAYAVLWGFHLVHPESRSPLSKLIPGHRLKQVKFNDDVVLTFKTGSSVIFNRVPIWLMDLSAARNMPCHHDPSTEYIPNQAYYSDAEMALGDVVFKDILANVSEVVKGLEDFQEYYRVHESLVKHTDPAIIAQSAKHTPIPKGWALDKFKFLPLHGDAYRRWSNAKWQISIEDDTFVFWNQLLKWLKQQDHNAHKLYGNPTLLVNGSLPFAHGGSVYAISRGLLKATYGQDPWGFERRWDHYVRYSCCGDAEISRALRLATNSTTIPNFEESKSKFQSESLPKVKFDVRDLCQPIFSLHHVTPFEYSLLRRFKKTLDGLVPHDDYIRYIDLWDWMMPSFLQNHVFTGPAQHGMTAAAGKSQWFHQVGWRAIARDDIHPLDGVTSKDRCQQACENREACLIYTFDHVSNECKLADDLYIGQIDPQGDRFTSGYNLSRITALRHQFKCAGRLGDLGQMSMQGIAHSLDVLRHHGDL